MLVTVQTWAQALLEHQSWESQAVEALRAADVGPGSTEIDAWEALEAAGLNRGAPRPEATVVRERKPRTYLPSSHWARLAEETRAKLDNLRDTGRDHGVINIPRTKPAGRRRHEQAARDTQRAAVLLERLKTYEYKHAAAKRREEEG